MKLLMTRPVGYFESWGHDFTQFFLVVSSTFRAPFSPFILERRQKSLQLISPKLSRQIKIISPVLCLGSGVQNCRLQELRQRPGSKKKLLHNRQRQTHQQQRDKVLSLSTHHLLRQNVSLLRK